MTRRKETVPYSPTAEQRDKVLGDVFYEIEQLFMASHLPTNHPSASNALLESALIHVRVLLDFFEWSRRTVNRRHKPPVENDDVLAVDFGFSPRPVEVDALYRERLNKDLVHLTYSRAARLPETRAWPHRTVVLPVLRRAIEFAEFLGPEGRSRAGGMVADGWERLLDSLKTYERLHSEHDI